MEEFWKLSSTDLVTRNPLPASPDPGDSSEDDDSPINDG